MSDAGPAAAAARASSRAFLSFEQLEFRYDPYPIGLARNVFSKDFYEELVKTWPPTSEFKYMPELGHKYSLSQINNPGNYHRYLASHPAWNDLHRYIKSKAFILQIMEMLYRRTIDLGIGGKHQAALEKAPSFAEKLKLWVRSRGLSCRWEFSMLPAEGGHIKPHTDHPKKIVTLVVPVHPEGEWNSSYGGGTDILRPKDITRNYNFMNKQMEFDEMETIGVFPYDPNQAVVFIKTFNSFHSVHPIHGPKDLMRKTITINMEQA